MALNLLDKKKKAQIKATVNSIILIFPFYFLQLSMFHGLSDRCPLQPISNQHVISRGLRAKLLLLCFWFCLMALFLILCFCCAFGFVSVSWFWFCCCALVLLFFLSQFWFCCYFYYWVMVLVLLSLFWSCCCL